MKTYHINPITPLAPHRIFIYLKDAANEVSIHEFIEIYMRMILSDNFDFIKEKFAEIIRARLGKCNEGEFYIAWLYKHLRNSPGKARATVQN